MKTNTWLSMAVVGALAVGAVTTFAGRALAQNTPQGGPSAATAAPATKLDSDNVDEQVGDQSGPEQVDANEPAEQVDANEPAETNEAQEPADAQSEAAESAALAAQAKITADQAQTAALAAHPGATVTKTELGDANGVISYSVEMSDGADVKIDAGTGAVLGVDAAGD